MPRCRHINNRRADECPTEIAYSRGGASLSSIIALVQNINSRINLVKSLQLSWTVSSLLHLDPRSGRFHCLMIWSYKTSFADKKGRLLFALSFDCEAIIAVLLVKTKLVLVTAQLLLGITHTGRPCPSRPCILLSLTAAGTFVENTDV